MRIILKQKKSSLRVFLSNCLIFCQFQSGIAYKSVAYKKTLCMFFGIFLSNCIFSISFSIVSELFCGELFVTCTFTRNFIANQFTSCFCCFLQQLYVHVLQISQHDQEVFGCIPHLRSCLNFCQYSQQKTKICKSS